MSVASSDESGDEADGEEEEFKQQAEATSAPNMGAGGSHTQAMMDQEWAKELREIRRMVQFLVHRERKLDVKTDVATRRLEKLERESSQLEDEEREASLPHQSREADCRQVVRRQGIWLWQGSHW